MLDACGALIASSDCVDDIFDLNRTLTLLYSFLAGRFNDNCRGRLICAI